MFSAPVELVGLPGASVPPALTFVVLTVPVPPRVPPDTVTEVAFASEPLTISKPEKIVHGVVTD
jgi:hypothetical protein